MSNPKYLQDAFLNACRKSRTPVCVYLTSGIKLTGVITSFAPYVFSLARTDDEQSTQVVYKHAVSTVMPLEPVNVVISSNAHP